MNATHYVHTARRLNHEMLSVAKGRRWFLHHAVREAMDMARCAAGGGMSARDWRTSLPADDVPRSWAESWWVIAPMLVIALALLWARAQGWL